MKELSSFTLSEVRKTAQRIAPFVRRTPLLESEFFSNEFDCRLFFKLESIQTTGSFKARGALSKVSMLSPQEVARGLITTSMGNHGLGMAYAAQAFATRAVVFAPTCTPALKLDALRSRKAEVHVVGENFDQTYRAAKEMEAREGLVYVHGFDDEYVIRGQATVALEILEDLPDVDVVVVAVGGGGLIAGIAAYCKQTRKSIQIFGVEPVGAAGMLQSRNAGKVVPLQSVSTIAESVAVWTVSPRALAYVTQFVDQLVTVDDLDTMAALVDILQYDKQLVEPAASCCIAALRKTLAPAVKGKKVCVVLCGSNFPLSRLKAYLPSEEG